MEAEKLKKEEAKDQEPLKKLREQSSNKKKQRIMVEKQIEQLLKNKQKLMAQLNL